MSCTDPIADMLTVIRNGLGANARKVDVPWSRIKDGICQVLKAEGYVTEVSVLDTKPAKTLRIALKYAPDGRPVISSIAKVSTPGRRQYTGSAELRPVMRGLGISILSTSQGILSDRACRQRKLGGELLCVVK